MADALEARFNPVAVRGEVSGFTRAASGHCYFTLKDAQGQLRCAMFKRAAQLLDFVPRDGELVELRGRLGVYEPRGELQLVVEHLRRAGQGTLFEQFVRLKAKLEAEGLFDPARKRAPPAQPRGIGLVTSLGAAALHDVATALQRRVPHIPVLLAPAPVQGAEAPVALVQALQSLARRADALDVILLVRGGGAMEDLWAFNDETLARAIVACPVPVICGVGHETDFTIADFCADVRAPTPTAAAELCAMPQAELMADLAYRFDVLQGQVMRHIDRQAQRLDHVQNRLGRPSQSQAQQKLQLQRLHLRMRGCLQARLERHRHALQHSQSALSRGVQQAPAMAHERLQRAALRLELLDPKWVLQRGFAWLSDGQGVPVTSVLHTQPGQALRATLADGVVDVTVTHTAQN